MRRFLLPMYLLLAACVPISPNETATRAAFVDTSLPAMKVFSVPRPQVTTASNADIARDFMDLSMGLESGRALDVFTRFEGPITVRLVGEVQPTVPSDLNRLLHRLRNEAGIDIAYTTSDTANITINAVSRANIQRFLPQAACFVVPNVSTFAEYRQARRSNRVNWGRITDRTRLGIFLPNDASPQEARDCLHEELAQALGPLNDLYRLPNSVFNDDNVHTVLTGYDMLILRAYYDPMLRNGMNRTQVMNRIPTILARINPAGEGRPATRLSRTPRPWIEAIQRALGPGSSPNARRAAVNEALSIATAMGWDDHRRGFTHYAMGRILQSTNPEAARHQFLQADAFFARSSETGLHRAYVASQLAAFALSEDRPDEALHLTSTAIDLAAQHENAALLSTLLMLRAEALDLSGRVSAGADVRLDSLGWARYGFGSDWAVRAKLREISALNPLNRARGSL
ncbi:DUF2927 domain-containing protein [Marivita hallyeonensis]|uniref:ATP-dependent transcriptional regulator n=1 Tax=Marivita hallyeonensis TaxID=996342 RepID=A0A1M5RFE6_9RHOB|nr:DUF2927 domain-containing protein [Marivita hallyeonensis]SHH25092.1 Protein of unknown function [Marivita hallyeonensis]